MPRRRMAGRSGMLGHNDVVTLQDIIELEAYLQSPASRLAPSLRDGTPGSTERHKGSTGHMMPGGQMPGH